MERCVGAAAMLPESNRIDLAVQALAGSETVTDLAARNGVSRKFVYEQADKARAVLDEAFLAAVPEDKALFELTITKAWLRQVIVALPLICHASYRGVIEFARAFVAMSIIVGTTNILLQSVALEPRVINQNHNMSRIRVGLHDEI